MRLVLTRLPILWLAGALAAQSLDAPNPFALIKKGVALSAPDAQAMEDRVEKQQDDTESRIQLLSYFSAAQMGADGSKFKAARARHLLWLIEHDPRNKLFQLPVGVNRFSCTGGELADVESFQRASELWVARLEKDPRNTDVRRAAVEAIRYCMPEKAESILLETNDGAGLGRLYGEAVLGSVGPAYFTNDPAGSEPSFRQRPFNAKAQHALEQATDAALLVAAAVTILRDGGTLWADGKLDWDYTPLGNNILSRAKAAAPDSLTLLTLQTTLPARGERPPTAIRVAGEMQKANIMRNPRPIYPPLARAQRIQGMVRMNALIGLHGEVVALHAISGPAELIRTTLEAVRGWSYKPPLFNGKPCYVLTEIEVNYEVRSR